MFIHLRTNLTTRALAAFWSPGPQTTTRSIPRERRSGTQRDTPRISNSNSCFGFFGNLLFVFKNSPAFGEFIKNRRESPEPAGQELPGNRFAPLARKPKLSMDDIAARGGPERHRLGIIERGIDDLSDEDLRQLDTAFGWPAGYARALLDFSVTSGDRMAQTATWARESPGLGLVDDHDRGDPILGYSADDTSVRVAIPREVLVDGGDVTPKALLSIAYRWRRLTAIDVNVFGADLQPLQEFAQWWEDKFRGEVVSTTDRVVGVREVAIDPLPAIHTLTDARTLVLAAEGHLDGVFNPAGLTRSAATIFWVAHTVRQAAGQANGNTSDVPADGLTALTSLAQDIRASGTQDGWSSGYSAFHAESGLSSVAAEIDTDAQRYVAGLLQARDQLTNILARTEADSGLLKWIPRGPAPMPITELDRHCLVIYDSTLSPELPTLLGWAASTSQGNGEQVLTIQRDAAHRTAHAQLRRSERLPGHGTIDHGFTINVGPAGPKTGGQGIRSTSIDPRPAVNTLSGWDRDSRTAVLITAGGVELQRVHIPPSLWGYAWRGAGL